MSQEPKNDNPAPTGTPAEPAGRTFTQADVDQIVADRLARERGKYQDYETLKEKAAAFDAAEEARKSELEKAQDAASKAQAELDALKKANAARDMRAKVAKETGVPAELLSGDDENACRDQAKALQAYAKGTGFPPVKDGGEPQNPSGGKTTRDQFADWASQNI